MVTLVRRKSRAPPQGENSTEDSDASSCASESICGEFDDTSPGEEDGGNDDGALTGIMPTKAGSRSATAVVKETYKDQVGAHPSKPEEDVISIQA